MWPKDETIAKRLKRDPKSSEARRLSELHRFRREVTGLTSAYEHVLKVIDCDKPYADVYLQGTVPVLARCQFVRGTYVVLALAKLHRWPCVSYVTMMSSQKFSRYPDRNNSSLRLCLCRRLNSLTITAFYSMLYILNGIHSILYCILCIYTVYGTLMVWTPKEWLATHISNLVQT